MESPRTIKHSESFTFKSPRTADKTKQSLEFMKGPRLSHCDGNNFFMKGPYVLDR